MIEDLFISQIKNDSKSIVRDPFLRFITPIPLLLALALITLQKNIIDLLAGYHIDYFQYSELIISLLILTVGPSMYGIIYGFILLDYKDERIFDALAVTPIGNGRLLIIKLIIPFIACILVNVFSLLLLTNTFSIEFLLLISFLSGLNAPFYALILSVLAKNKIQGMTVQKVSGVLMIIPIVSYFYNEPITLIFGIDPLYWTFQSFWLFRNDSFQSITYGIIGILYYIFIIILLITKLN